MLLARVVGTVVATRKDDRLQGRKLLVCRPVAPDGTVDGGYVVAVDTVGAGVQETVLLVSGSSARMAGGKDSPVDSAVVGIVDEVRLESESDSSSNSKRPAAVAGKSKH
ncbi:MAG: EutN/CcmL family microcompartment protein [Acidobacteriia bacterium]|nr:EutN/CcmL family microcompartment protein [Terriglobia bacterium]